MKHLKTFLSFLAIICCLAGSTAQVSASGNAGAAPRVVFTNKSKDSPDLRVAKTVEAEDPEHPAPEGARFRFELRLNGKIAAGEPYILTDQDGEIIRKPDTFQTDEKGIFTLEAGQTATFTYVGNNVPYTVTEQETYFCPRRDESGQILTDSSNRLYRKNENGETLLRQEYQYQLRKMETDGYQLSTINGSDSGNVIPDMPKVEFVNTYTDPAKDSSELKVTKKIIFPAEYEVPDNIGNAGFVFMLEIEDHANRTYTVLNAKDGSTMRSTDADGYFWLCPGETAVFTDIPVNTGYRVEELMSKEGECWPLWLCGEDGEQKEVPFWWYPADETVREGDQLPAAPVTFQNTSSSFRVRKTMEDNTEPEDVEFTFQLTDAKGDPVTNAVYYRYELASQEMVLWEGVGEWEGEYYPIRQQEWLTDENGYFRLEAGQEAVFCGFVPGTSFTVKELGHLIEDANGELKVDPSYADQPPQSGTVSSTGQLPSLRFVNRPQETDGILTVSKLVENEGQEGSKIDDEFHFLLYRRLSTAEEVQKELKLSDEEDLNTGMQNALTQNPSWKIIPTETSEGWLYNLNDSFYEVYIPVNGAVYHINADDGGTESYATASSDKGWGDGEFAIKAGQTARFQALLAGRQYRVEEIDLTAEYMPKAARDLALGESAVTAADGITQMVSRLTEGGYEYAQTASLTQEGLAFTFTNLYQPKKIDLQIRKTDETGNPRAGAEFMLYLDRGKSSPIYPEGLEEEQLSNFRYRTGEDGTLTEAIPALKAGTYWLYEEKAPSGYCVLEAPIQIEIRRTPEGLTAIIDGKSYTESTSEIQNEAVSSILFNMNRGSDADGNAQNDELILTIPNLYLYELPSSGGIGIYWYSIGGTLLMLAATLILYRIKRRGRC